MTRTQILKEFTDNIRMFQKLAYNIGGEQDADDLFQTCSLMLLEFSEERLVSYYNPKHGLRPFFIRMLCNQYRSTTSKFHKDYRKQDFDLQKNTNDIILNMPQSEDQYDAVYFDKIDKACISIHEEAENQNLANLEKEVWDFYVDTGSLRKTTAAITEKYTDLITLKDVHTIVKKFQRTIKEKLCSED